MPRPKSSSSEVKLSRPLCLLVDVRLPGMSGLDLVRQLQQGPMCPVVVMITGHGDVPLAVKAMRAGALHFLEKPFEPAELLQTLEEAHQRVSEIAAEEATYAAIEASYRSLTAREQEVMALLAEGMPTKLLATKLGISTRTAEHHRAAVLKKMGARTVSHLARMSMSLQARNAPHGRRYHRHSGQGGECTPRRQHVLIRSRPLRAVLG